MDQDLKVVVHLKGGHAHIGVQEQGADPVMERVEAGSLEEALGAVPGVLGRAQERWAQGRQNPAYQGPPPAPQPRQQATAQHSGRSRQPQEGTMQRML